MRAFKGHCLHRQIFITCILTLKVNIKEYLLEINKKFQKFRIRIYKNEVDITCESKYLCPVMASLF